jgi:hypothetical protein
MYQGKLTKAKLLELLKDVPGDTCINVLNRDGELSANVEFWFENLDTRKFVDIIGLKPLWKIRQEKRAAEIDIYVMSNENEDSKYYNDEGSLK